MSMPQDQSDCVKIRFMITTLDELRQMARELGAAHRKQYSWTDLVRAAVDRPKSLAEWKELLPS